MIRGIALPLTIELITISCFIIAKFRKGTDMARLHITGDPTQLQIGKWISRIAAKIADGGLAAVSFPNPRKIRYTEEFGGFFQETLEFDDSIPAADDQLDRAMPAMADVEGENRVYVQFHFDRTIEAEDDSTFRIVNVVIPDFTTKLVRDSNGDVVKEDDAPLYDLNRIAEESFGYDSRRACE